MVDDEILNRWFCRDVLPLERGLVGFLRRDCPLSRSFQFRGVGDAGAAKLLNDDRHEHLNKNKSNASIRRIDPRH